jgi:hypothetical protein
MNHQQFYYIYNQIRHVLYCTEASLFEVMLSGQQFKSWRKISLVFIFLLVFIFIFPKNYFIIWITSSRCATSVVFNLELLPVLVQSRKRAVVQQTILRMLRGGLKREEKRSSYQTDRWAICESAVASGFCITIDTAVHTWRCFPADSRPYFQQKSRDQGLITTNNHKGPLESRTKERRFWPCVPRGLYCPARCSRRSKNSPK